MSILEKTTYACLISVSVVSLYILLEARYSRHEQPSEKSVVGSKANLAGANWGSNSKNVVLLLRTGCHFCAESLPLYRKLSAIRREKGDGLRILVASWDPPDVMRKYLSEQNISVDDILPCRTGIAGIAATPAMFFVDARGVIRKALIGRLNESGEEQVLGLLHGPL
jgi:hypothetical protein